MAPSVGRMLPGPKRSSESGRPRSAEGQTRRQPHLPGPVQGLAQNSEHRISRWSQVHFFDRWWQLRTCDQDICSPAPFWPPAYLQTATGAMVHSELQH